MSETSETTGTSETNETTGQAEAGTLHYRVATLPLGPDRPTASLPPGIDRVVIEADVVRIEGLVRWPGCAVDLSARVIEVVGSEPAVLDVSGAEPAPSFDGADHAPAGQPGAPGGPGCDGGAVTIAASGIVGALDIRSNGGPGGNGQGGGDGVPPKPPAAAEDGRFTKTTSFGIHGTFTSSGPHGGRVLVEPGLGRAYVAVAYGQAGGRGPQGGSAAPAGQPGNGGAAGPVRVRLGSRVEVAPTIETRGGAAGAPGPAGQPTPGGPGVPGGHNRIYWYSWPNTHEGFTDADDTLREAARVHRITHQAPNGLPGHPGTAPESPTAEPGRPTDPIVEQRSPADLGTDLSSELLTLILVRAEHDLGDRAASSTGARARAEARLRWLVDVTAERQDEDGRRVNEAAAEHLAIMADEPATAI